MTATKKISLKESEVLRVLATGGADFGCFTFKGILSRTVCRLTRSDVRRACRSLKRKGFAEFHHGLWSEDGDPAGAGYRATRSGRFFLEPYEG